MLAFFLALGGCASDVPGGLSNAGGDADGPLKSLARTTKFATDVPQPKDFVVKSRGQAGDLNYIPVFQRLPARTEPVLNPQGVKAQEQALEAVRINHDRISGRPVVPLKVVNKARRKKPPAAPVQVNIPPQGN